MTYVMWGGRVALATVFAIAAISKLKSRGAFAELVASLPAFGVPERASLGAAIVALELSSAAALIFAPQLGGALAAIVLVGFSLGIARALRAPEPVACRCFGASRTPVARGHLVRNAVLAAGAVTLAIRAGVRAPAHTLEVAIATAVALGLGVLVTRWDDLAFIFSTPDLPGRRTGKRTSR